MVNAQQSEYRQRATELAAEAKGKHAALWAWHEAVRKRAEELAWAKDRLPKPKRMWQAELGIRELECPLCGAKVHRVLLGYRTYYGCTECCYEYAT